MASILLKRLLLCFALAYSFSILVARWGTPLSSPHAFRETQTAMTVYWMVNGDGQSNLGDDSVRHSWSVRDHYRRFVSKWVAYQTPVMGPPWTIPYEFPTFQWIVAGVIYATGISLDNAGRLVSWLLLESCLFPAWKLARRHEVDPCCLGALLLCSPAYLYWGTAVLIETCSLFLCLMFLWTVGEERWILALIFGVFAAVTKVTTFVLIAFVVLVLRFRSITPIVIVGAALLCAVGWNHYTDLLKSQNPLSAVLMSSQPAQQLHNFGTLAQRLSWELIRTLWESIKGLL